MAPEYTVICAWQLEFSADEHAWDRTDGHAGGRNRWGGSGGGDEGAPTPTSLAHASSPLVCLLPAASAQLMLPSRAIRDDASHSWSISLRPAAVASPRPARRPLTRKEEAALELALADSFPIIDWLAVGNHMFLLASGGYFLQNFWRAIVGNKLDYDLGLALQSAVFFSLSLLYIASAVCYWVDCVSFPETWTRRKCYHPLKRRRMPHHETVREKVSAFEQAAAEAEGPSTYVPPSHSFSNGNGIMSPSGGPSPFLEHDSVQFGSSRPVSESGWSSLSSHTQHLLSLLRCDRAWPWRTETWSELANIGGSLVNFVSTLLPYWLQTFRPDRGVSFASVPLSMALLDMGAMVLWLGSAWMVFHVWRRDQRAAAREEWEAATARLSGVTVEQRRRLQKIEDEAQKRLRKAARKEALLQQKLQKSQGDGDASLLDRDMYLLSSPSSSSLLSADFIDPSTRFQSSAVRQWFAPGNLQWWSCVMNVLASSVYLAATVYMCFIAGLAHSNLRRYQRSDHGGVSGYAEAKSGITPSAAGDDAFSLTPEQIADMLLLQRFISLIGDVAYLACAILCEMVYYRETLRELGQERAERRRAAKAAAAAAAATNSLTGGQGMGDGVDEEEDGTSRSRPGPAQQEMLIRTTPSPRPPSTASSSWSSHSSSSKHSSRNSSERGGVAIGSVCSDTYTPPATHTPPAKGPAGATPPAATKATASELELERAGTGGRGTPRKSKHRHVHAASNSSHAASSSRDEEMPSAAEFNALFASAK